MFKLLIITAFLSLFVQGANAVEINRPKGVVELFTSQGCNSCPPADAFVGELSVGSEILALAWHVDYWDYLGWKDTFAKKSHAERQYGYAKMLRERQVYTPQAVINGRTHTPGSNKREIRNRVKSFNTSLKGLNVPVDVSEDGESLQIGIENNSESKGSTLYLVFFNKDETVKIKRGENKGKTLTYHNIVREVVPLGMVKENGLKTNYPLAEMKRGGFDTCAFILQRMDEAGNPSAIVGATVVSGLSSTN